MTCSKISTGLGSASAATSMNRASSKVAGVMTLSPGMWAYQPSRLCECCAASWRPAPVAMRITTGTWNCPPDMWRIVAALLTIWSSAKRLKLTVMISTIGRIPPSAAPGADKGRFGKRCVADALGTKFVEEPLGDRVAAAVAPNILAHQKDVRISAKRLSDRLAHRVAVGDLAHIVGHGAPSPA